jgi:hypothetical protein
MLAASALAQHTELTQQLVRTGSFKRCIARDTDKLGGINGGRERAPKTHEKLS